MGAGLSTSTSASRGFTLDSFVAELGGDVVYEKSLGTSRFLKTIRGRNKNGRIVVKIFSKADPGMPLFQFVRRLKKERTQLMGIPNVYTYQHFIETEKAGYMSRQWLGSNLYDRISTRPFLSLVEKKWIAFQLLCAMRDARACNVSHGDIKSENVLVTSSNWVYLTDFAAFKPTFLPLDDPSDFSFFFDTSSRRTCYVAPERFYEADSKIAKRREVELERGDEHEGKRVRVSEAMDVFSAGCVVAELFLEGSPLFTFSQLLRYREREYDPEPSLAGIEDEHIRDMVRSMISRDPSARLSFAGYLSEYRAKAFPETFYIFLHSYLAGINEIVSTSPTPPPSGLSSQPAPSNASAAGDVPAVPSSGSSSSVVADERIERLWADWSEIASYFGGEAVTNDHAGGCEAAEAVAPSKTVFPVRLNIPNVPSPALQPATPGQHTDEDGTALIVSSLICATMRNCLRPSSKQRALELLLATAPHLSDETKLDRMLPYVVSLLADEVAPVRAAALRTVTQLLLLVGAITPSNASVFPEYIVPHIQSLTTDPDVGVRSMLAQCIAPLAEVGGRFLEMTQAMKAHGSFKLGATSDGELLDGTDAFEASYDVSLQDLQNVVQTLVTSLLIDQSPVVRRILLSNAVPLCLFFGRTRSNDIILSHVITYLNDRDWQVRAAFFENIVGIATCVGGRSVEEYILPLVVQALADVEETVVVKVLNALTSLAELGLFNKIRLWELINVTAGFLAHPNVWMRQSAAGFISASAKQLPATDVWCIIYPSLRPLLKADLRVINELSLLDTVVEPLPRQMLEAAMAWSLKPEQSLFWKAAARDSRGKGAVAIPKDGLKALRSSMLLPAKGTLTLSDDDEIQLEKLRHAGLKPEDEVKLVALRDYLWSVAHMQSSTSRLGVGTDGESIRAGDSVQLSDLNVAPQTVFVGLRTSELVAGSLEAALRPRSSLSRQQSIESWSRHVSMTPRMTPPPDMTRSSRDYGASDLRRRLALGDGSSTSLALPSPPSQELSTPNALDIPGLPQLSQRPVELAPSSPSESAISFSAQGSPIIGRHRGRRVPIGSSDTQKAAPAVASSMTNAIGTLEIPSKLRQLEEEALVSGRTTPVSNVGGPSGRADYHTFESRPFYHTYEGRDPAILTLLEQTCLDNFRPPMPEFGPRITPGPPRRRAIRQTFHPRERSNRTSNATLIAHLTEHKSAVTAIAVSPDHLFFVTASSDGSVRVWDSARLEKNVTSRARQTFSRDGGRVTALCMLENSHCVAIAAEDGSLAVLRVDVTQGSSMPKYSKLTVIRDYQLEDEGEYITTMHHFNTDTSSNLLFATSCSTISILDLRTLRTTLSMTAPLEHGPITSICVDRRRTWLVAGTASGHLTLWDLRFGLLLRSWRVRRPGATVQQIELHPNKGRGRWIVVALGEAPEGPSARAQVPFVEVWDVDRGRLVESYEIGSTGETEPIASSASSAGRSPQPPAVQAPPDPVVLSPAEAIEQILRTRSQASPSPFPEPAPDSSTSLLVPVAPSARTFLVSSSSESSRTAPGWVDGAVSVVGDTLPPGSDGYLIVGGDDRRIRFWDLGAWERSGTLSGGDLDERGPTYSTEQPASSSSPVRHIEQPATAHHRRHRTALISHQQQHLLRQHHDAVTALGFLESPFRCLVSGDRAGVVKVWRLED